MVDLTVRRKGIMPTAGGEEYTSMMQRRIIRSVALVTLFLLVVAWVGVGYAQVYNVDEDLPKPTGFEKRLTKLGRGLSNILFGWGEIPVTFDKKLKEGKPFAYLFGVAPVLGTARAVMRTSTGVFEVVTFPFSDRDVNFQAVLEPEYIF
jgi:putative exosortase-associated protein (TIGR04073 family)